MRSRPIVAAAVAILAAIFATACNGEDGSQQPEARERADTAPPAQVSGHENRQERRDPETARETPSGEVRETRVSNDKDRPEVAAPAQAPPAEDVDEPSVRQPQDTPAPTGDGD